MKTIKALDGKRSHGVVWVCDLVGSSRHLNCDQSVDALETFLRRFYWIADKVVDAAGGQFIKWTGDGFLAWFRTKHDRNSGQQAAAVFQAAWSVSSIINVTQLGLKLERKFRIRHGITYEHDALLMKVIHSDGHESFDLIGRDVVLAFRLSGIPAEFPSIVTQKELAIKSLNYLFPLCEFEKRFFSTQDVLKYFKGEKWGTTSIYVSHGAGPTLKLIRRAIDELEAPSLSSETMNRFAQQFVSNMQDGPDWCRKIVKKHDRFFEDLLDNLNSLFRSLGK